MRLEEPLTHLGQDEGKAAIALGPIQSIQV